MDSREFLSKCIKTLIEKGGSDLHLKEKSPPRIRVKGTIVKTDIEVASRPIMEGLVELLLSDVQRKIMKEKGGLDFAFNFEDYGRYRGNFFWQQSGLSFSIRLIQMSIPTFKDLHIPDIFQKISENQRGLILVSGATSAGKSTTVASLIDYINTYRESHIITLEDPIEYLHRDKKAIINQREIGFHVPTFHDALRYVVRQDPDIIVIGEMRDSESFQSAITASETGHLVISTLHARDVMQCFDRILGFFPPGHREQVLIQMSFNLRAISCQRLIPRKDGNGVVPAFEILCQTPSVDKLIRDNKLEKLPNLLRSGEQDGMQSFNQALIKLHDQGLITKDMAYAYSDNPQALEMNFKGIFLDESSGGIIGE